MSKLNGSVKKIQLAHKLAVWIKLSWINSVSESFKAVTDSLTEPQVIFLLCPYQNENETAKSYMKQPWICLNLKLAVSNQTGLDC